MSMQGLNQQNLSTVIPKTVEKTTEKTPEKQTGDTGTGGAQDRDDGPKQIDSDHSSEISQDHKAEQAKTEKVESSKEKFMEKVSQEEIKSTHKVLSETVSKAMETQDVKPERLEKQSFNVIEQGLEKIKDKKSEESEEKEQPKSLGKSLLNEESHESLVLIGGILEGESGGAKYRDDNEKLDDSKKNFWMIVKKQKLLNMNITNKEKSIMKKSITPTSIWPN